MCALLNFIKVFCIVLHILTFHSLHWSIYPHPPTLKVVNYKELQVTTSIYLFISAKGKKEWHLDFDFVHQ